MRYFLLIDEDLNVLGGEGLSCGEPAPMWGLRWVESEGLKGYEVYEDVNGNLKTRPKEKPENEKIFELKKLKKEQVKQIRDTLEWKGCSTPHGIFDTTPDSQRKVNGACTAALALGSSFSIVWRLRDNSKVTLNNTQIIEVGLSISNHVDVCQQRKNALDELLDAATTIAELDDIDINSGWPTAIY